MNDEEPTSVWVGIRVKPHQDSSSDLSVKCDERHLCLHDIKRNHGILNKRNCMREFVFDRCFGVDATQEEIFHSIGAKTIQAFGVERTNCSVIAYGQTGSGKTFTMLGNDLNRGLIPRICEQILLMSDLGHFTMTFFEIYNEKVYDLLLDLSSVRKRNRKQLRIRQHPTQGPYVEGLHYRELRSEADVTAVLRWGCAARSTSETAGHATSSRSHAVFTLHYPVSTKNGFDSTKDHEAALLAAPKLHLVDLAGSERPSHHSAVEQAKESAHINKSLATLGNVILALSAKSKLRLSSSVNKFIPYRNSTLTWLLRDSLGGSAKTIVIGTISSDICCRAETLKTLRYANRARNIRSVIRNSSSGRPGNDDDEQRRLVERLREEIRRLSSQLTQSSPFPSIQEECPAKKRDGATNTQEDGYQVCQCGSMTGEWTVIRYDKSSSKAAGRSSSADTTANGVRNGGVSRSCMTSPPPPTAMSITGALDETPPPAIAYELRQTTSKNGDTTDAKRRRLEILAKLEQIQIRRRDCLLSLAALKSGRNGTTNADDDVRAQLLLRQKVDQLETVELEKLLELAENDTSGRLPWALMESPSSASSVSDAATAMTVTSSSVGTGVDPFPTFPVAANGKATSSDEEDSVQLAIRLQGAGDVATPTAVGHSSSTSSSSTSAGSSRPSSAPPAEQRNGSEDAGNDIVANENEPQHAQKRQSSDSESTDEISSKSGEMTYNYSSFSESPTKAHDLLLSTVVEVSSAAETGASPAASPMSDGKRGTNQGELEMQILSAYSEPDGPQLPFPKDGSSLNRLMFAKPTQSALIEQPVLVMYPQTEESSTFLPLSNGNEKFERNSPTISTLSYSNGTGDGTSLPFPKNDSSIDALKSGMPSVSDVPAKPIPTYNKLLSFSETTTLPLAPYPQLDGPSPPFPKNAASLTTTPTTRAPKTVTIISPPRAAFDASVGSSDSSIWSEENLPVAHEDEFTKSGTFLTFQRLNDLTGDPDESQSTVVDDRLTKSYSGSNKLPNSGPAVNGFGKSLPEADLRKAKRKIKLDLASFGVRMAKRSALDEDRPKFAFLRRSQNDARFLSSSARGADPLSQSFPFGGHGRAPELQAGSRSAPPRVSLVSLNSSTNTQLSSSFKETPQSDKANESSSSQPRLNSASRQRKQRIRERAERKRLHQQYAWSSSENSDEAATVATVNGGDPLIRLPTIPPLHVYGHNGTTDRRLSLARSFDALQRKMLIGGKEGWTRSDSREEIYANLVKPQDTADTIDVEKLTNMRQSDESSKPRRLSQDRSILYKIQTDGPSLPGTIEEDSVSIATTTISGVDVNPTESPSHEAWLVDNNPLEADAKKETAEDTFRQDNDTKKTVSAEISAKLFRAGDDDFCELVAVRPTVDRSRAADIVTVGSPAAAFDYRLPPAADEDRSPVMDISSKRRSWPPAHMQAGSLSQFINDASSSILKRALSDADKNTERHHPEPSSESTEISNDSGRNPAISSLYNLLIRSEVDKTNDIDQSQDEEVLNVTVVDGVPFVSMQPADRKPTHRASDPSDALLPHELSRRSGSVDTELPFVPPRSSSMDSPLPPEPPFQYAAPDRLSLTLDLSPTQLSHASSLCSIDGASEKVAASDRIDEEEDSDYEELLIDPSDANFHPAQKAVSWGDLHHGRSLEVGPSLSLGDIADADSPRKPIIKKSAFTEPLYRDDSRLRMRRTISVPNVSDAEAQTEPPCIRRYVRPLYDDGGAPPLSAASSLYDIASPESTDSYGAILRHNALQQLHDLKLLVRERDRCLGSLRQTHGGVLREPPAVAVSRTTQHYQRQFRDKLLKAKVELDMRIDDVWYRLKTSDLADLTPMQCNWLLNVFSSTDLTLAPRRSPVVEHQPPEETTDESADQLRNSLQYQGQLAGLRRALIGAYRSNADTPATKPVDSFQASTTESSGYYSIDFAGRDLGAEKRHRTASWVVSSGSEEPPSRPATGATTVPTTSHGPLLQECARLTEVIKNAIVTETRHIKPKNKTSNEKKNKRR